MAKRLKVTVRISNEGRIFALNGRDAWALLELLKAGAKGCTLIDHPGPRWSGYVFSLKQKHGLSIETVYEPHRGRFPGTHARYVMRSPVEIINRSDVAELAAA